VNVDDVTVLAFSALLNVALTVVATFTPVAPIPGTVELTLSAGGVLVTVSVVLPDTCASAAEIVLVPPLIPFASPDELIVATALAEDVHVT
jgi:hypothetical protein